MGKVLTITAGLIALYLIVANATGSGQLINSGGSVYVDAVKALQGR